MKTINSRLRRDKIRFLAAVDKAGCLEVFSDLQAQMLGILCKRGKQGTSLTRSLKNAIRIKVHRQGDQLVLSWHNSHAEDGRSTLVFRKRDRLSGWLREHVLGRPRHQYGNSRRAKDRIREARRQKRRLREYYAAISVADIAANIAHDDERRQQENFLPIASSDHKAQAA